MRAFLEVARMFHRTSIVAFLTVSCMTAFGQKGGGPATTPAPTTGTTPTTTTTPPRTTTTPTTTQPTMENINRPIFLSGKVMMDDGTPPPDSVVIESVCGGRNPRPEAYTDTKGHFQFQLGQNSAMMADASVGNLGSMGGYPGGGGYGGGQQGTGMSSGGMGSSTMSMSRDLVNCDLRANLPGYRSDVLNLSGHRMFDNPDVGTIILHRMGNVEGTTISMTSLQAPKEAKKAYEKGKDFLKKKKHPEAQKEFQKAVDAYPRYAAAWFELGRLQEEGKQVDEARKSYHAALEADKRYVNPYLQLSMIAARESNWQDLADTTTHVVKLDPVDYPHAWFLNSVANYNLKKFDEAEKSAREAQKLDTQHRNPKIAQVLGLALIEKHDYPGAAEQLRAYLQFAPSAPDAAQVRNQLAELDKVTGGSAKAKEEQ